ncbi:MAG: AraC family transcriptional regulator [Planctomycetota bacterium]|jgi:AraC family transcriptional regulator
MKSQTEQTYKQRILRVLVHIQDRLDDALCLEDLARIAHFSPCHFHRVFRGMVGESLMEHIRRLRLERAAHRLKFTDQRVTGIAFDAGYETHEAFTRAFRAMFGQAPSQFRKTSRTASSPDVPSSVHFVPDGTLEDFNPVDAGGLPMEVRIEKVEPVRVAFMRHVGPYDQVGQTWEKLCAWAAPRGLLGPKLTMLGICHDVPEVTPQDKIRYDACLAVDDQFEPDGEVGVQEIAAGEYAVTTHQGPYKELGETYARLCGNWLPASGREVSPAPPFEIYLNSPEGTNPEDLLTDVYVPLEPKQGPR